MSELALKRSLDDAADADAPRARFSNLPFEATEVDVDAWLRATHVAGQPGNRVAFLSVEIERRANGRSKGIALVRFGDAAARDAALALEGSEFGVAGGVGARRGNEYGSRRGRSVSDDSRRRRGCDEHRGPRSEAGLQERGRVALARHRSWRRAAAGNR